MTSTTTASLISLIRSFNVKPGIVFENTELDEVLNFNLLKSHDVHNVLLMGVVSGRGGQKFTLETARLISKLRDLSDHENYELQIEVDGGLTWENAITCRDNGADFLSGWSMYLSNGYDKIDQTIKNFVNEI